MKKAAAGGLFGLGFGFSLLSLAEIFYFSVVRWMFILHQKKKEKLQATITPTLISVSQLLLFHSMVTKIMNVHKYKSS